MKLSLHEKSTLVLNIYIALIVFFFYVKRILICGRLLRVYNTNQNINNKTFSWRSYISTRKMEWFINESCCEITGLSYSVPSLINGIENIANITDVLLFICYWMSWKHHVFALLQRFYRRELLIIGHALTASSMFGKLSWKLANTRQPDITNPHRCNRH